MTIPVVRFARVTGGYRIAFEYDETLVALIKTVPPKKRSYNRETKEWIVYDPHGQRLADDMAELGNNVVGVVRRVDSGYGHEDVVLADRLILAVLDQNAESYDATLAEVHCLLCAHRLINALASVAAARLVARPGGPEERADAIKRVEQHLTKLLDAEGGTT